MNNYLVEDELTQSVREFCSQIDHKKFIEETKQDDEFNQVKPINAYPNINKSYGGNGNVNLLKTHGRYKSTNMGYANDNPNLLKTNINKSYGGGGKKPNLREKKRLGLL